MHYFGSEIKYTKRYRLGQALSSLARHFLLLTATPHNGKEADFQLFMALLDGDRFEGKFRDGVHVADTSDLMRRLVKEQLLIVPISVIRGLQGIAPPERPTFATDTERSERIAMQTVLETERRLGYEPRDVSDQKNGYDIESGIPGTGRLRFLEVKGRVKGARTVTVTKNEILTALNKPEDFILAIVELNGGMAAPRYIRQPFENEPDFTVTSVNFDLDKLLAKAQPPA